MKEFFKPWRRKIGVVTLVMACVFAAGWVRSLSGKDTIHIGNRDEYDFSRFVSLNGTIEWEWATPDRTIYRDPLKMHNQIVSLLATQRESNADLRMRRAGRYYFQIDIFNLTIWFVPYWSIVIPLTVVSAWLLLSKPRVKKPEPTSVVGP